VNRGPVSEFRTPSSKTKPLAQLYEPGEPASFVAHILDVVLAAGICLLLAFEPLAFGGVLSWGIVVLEVGAALLLMIWAARGIAMGRLEIIPNPLFTPMVVFAALIAAQLLLARTAYWYVTWQMGMLWAAYGILVFLVVQTFRRTAWLRRLGIFFAVFGFLVAVVAVAEQFAGNGKLYWLIPNQSGWPFYGPYIDHSHYAGLMEMLVPIPLVFAMAGFFRSPVRVLFGFAALIMASTIFLSQSLGGIIAFTAEMVALAILVARRRSAWQQLALLGLLCVLLGMWVVMLQPGGLVARLARLQDPLGKAGGDYRLTIVKDSVKMIRERPILGWGLGTFPVVYPAFRSFYTNYLVNEAHNDFVQMVVETGIVGGALMLAFVLLLYRTGLQRIDHWRRDPRAGMALAALVGCTGLLVHGLSDFNLQIPANAALFFVLASIATSSRLPSLVIGQPGADS
jgi:O-antigen ligase